MLSAFAQFERSLIREAQKGLRSCESRLQEEQTGQNSRRSLKLVGKCLTVHHRKGTACGKMSDEGGKRGGSAEAVDEASPKGPLTALYLSVTFIPQHVSPYPATHLRAYILFGSGEVPKCELLRLC